MYEKKSQNAVEFLIILAFVLFLITSIMFITGSYLVDFKEEEIKKTADDFVASVNNEITILNNVETGYYRELPIRSSKYDIKINQTSLTLHDTENNKTFYYDLIGNFNVTLRNGRDPVTGQNISWLIFTKYRDVDNRYNLRLLKDDIIVKFSFLNSNLTMYFIPNSTCTIGVTTYGVKMYGLESYNNSHVEIPSQTNYNISMCLEHRTYALGNDCIIANHERLFYLGDINNSHIWIDNSSALPGPLYNWQEVCVSSPGGTINVSYALARPTSTHICIGSFIGNDTMGGVMGNCSQTSPYQKIWLSIE